LRIYKGKINYTEFLIVVLELPEPSDAVVGKLYVDTTNQRLSVLNEAGDDWIHIIKGQSFSLILSETQPTGQVENDLWYEDLNPEKGEPSVTS
jgi:hypothetical protein